MLKQLYLILISILVFEAALKANEMTNTEGENIAPAEETVAKPGDAPSAVKADVEVSESELIEMVGYLTAQGARISVLELNDSGIAALAAGLLEGLNGEKKLNDIPQESIQEAYSEAQERAVALESESEEIPEISEDTLQIIGLDMLEKSGLIYLGFGAEDADLIIKGFTTGARATEPDPAMQDKLPAFQKFIQKRVAALQAKMATEVEAAAGERAAAAKVFFEELALDPEVQKSESGLYYKILEPGSDKKPTLKDTVLVHYKGTLIDGTQFDSSYDRGSPATFPLNRVVPGFGEGLTKIGAGGKIILYIPSNLGYGNSPSPGSAIKPGDTLIFECELLKVNPK